MSKFSETLLTAARATLSVKEDAPNRGKWIDEWLLEVGCPTGQPWCAAWVYAMHKIAADALDIANLCPRTASAIHIWQAADKKYREPTPAPGDVFVLDKGNGHGHTGIVELVTPDGETIVTIEGNTNAAGSREGDRVAKQTWKPRDGKRGKLVGYLHFGPTDDQLRKTPPLGLDGLPPSPLKK